MQIHKGQFSLANPTPFVGTSKSYFNRLLILLVRENPLIELTGEITSEDVKSLVTVLKDLDLIEQQGHVLKQKRSIHELSSKETITLETNEGGTTNRFLMALLCLSSVSFVLKPHASFFGRPHDEIISALKKLGARIEQKSDHYLIQGPIRPGEKITVGTGKSTQFLSALALIGAAGLEQETGYLAITKQSLKLVAASRVSVPEDMSSLCYPCAYEFVTKKRCQLDQSRLDDHQPDTLFLRHLITGQIPEQVDVALYPDQFLSFLFLAQTLGRPMSFINTSVLRLKESDRIQSAQDLFALYGAKLISQGEGRLQFTPGDKTQVTPSFTSPRDHRVAMIATMLFSFYDGGSISGHECIAKSFTNFFEVMKG